MALLRLQLGTVRGNMALQNLWTLPMPYMPQCQGLDNWPVGSGVKGRVYCRGRILRRIAKKQG